MISKMPSIQIAFATADPRCRYAVLAALQTEPGFEVVADICDHDHLLALAPRLNPDVLLIDSEMADQLPRALKLWPAVRTILLANSVDEGQVIRAIRASASGILPKSAPAQVLVKGIRNVLAGRYCLQGDSVVILVRLLHDLLREQTPEPPYERHGLTAREQTVIAMIAVGHSNREIGQKLAISERTVKHHLTSIFTKLGLTSRLQLAAFAVTHRMGPKPCLPDGSSTVYSRMMDSVPRKTLSLAAVTGA